VLTLRLVRPGKPYWERPDLALGLEDVEVHGQEVKLKVHNLGSAQARSTTVVFHNRAGEVIATGKVPPLPAPVDLYPRTAEVILTLPGDVDATGGVVEIDPDHRLEEITRCNNAVRL